jgi:hypothetical protein
MVDGGSTAPQHVPRRWRAETDDALRRPQLDSAACATELLAIVAYVTSADGPLQDPRRPGGNVSPWHQRLLTKAAERLDVIDASMRARVAFLAAGRDQGYYAPEAEIELAGASLDTCRATTSVVAALLEGRLPTIHDFEAMSRAALTINPALDATREAEAPRPSR